MPSVRRCRSAVVKLFSIISICLVKADCLQKVPEDHATKSPDPVKYFDERSQQITSHSDTSVSIDVPSNHKRNSELISDQNQSNNDNQLNPNYLVVKKEEVEDKNSQAKFDSEHNSKAENNRDSRLHKAGEKWSRNNLEASRKPKRPINSALVWTGQEHHQDSVNDWWGAGGRTRHRRAKDDGTCELEIKCKGEVDQKRTGGATPGSGGALTVKLPIRGQRGSSGDKGEKGEPGRPGVAFVAKGDNNIQREARPKIAFFVGLSKNLGPLTRNSDVIFDRVVTNVGGGYEEATGIFVAPVDGTYQFNVVLSAQGKQKAAVMILQNGKMVSTVWAESVPSWSTSSSTLILSLKANDKVNLLALQQASYLHGYMYTSFSGHLLFED